MNEELKVPTMQVPPIKRVCMTIGQLPASYVETMSYYEMLVWFVHYLRDDVIPVVNANGLATKELQELFVQLQSYVNSYFDNLDVQDEINNKLDEMAESGQLTDIIAQYLGLAGMITFNTVAEMKVAENLVNGSKCATLGYRTVNDGGNAFYKVRTITNDDTVDEMTIIELADDTLIAELIVDLPCDPLKLGAYGNGTNDDITYIQKAVSFKNVKLTKGSYKISSSILIPTETIFDGNDIPIIPDSGVTAFQIIGNGISNPVKNTTLKNINIDATNGGNGIYLKDGYFNYFDNINIQQLTGNDKFGIKIENGFNHIFNNGRILGNLSNTGQIGFDISSTQNGDNIENMTNNSYKNFLIQNVAYGVKTNYLTTCNITDFENLGFTACGYAIYLKGNAKPITIRNARIEQGTSNNDNYGIYIHNDGVTSSIDSVNIYNIKYPIYNNSTGDLYINGSCTFTGTSQSPKYVAFTSNGNIITNANLYINTDAYNPITGDTLASGKFWCNSNNFVNKGNTITGDSFNMLYDNRIYKATHRVFNLYGIRGYEGLIYTDTNDGYVLQSSTNGSSTSLITGDNIVMVKDRLYHIRFLDNNKWTLID